MSKKIALIGDVHGCIDELTELYAKLQHHSVDEIFHLGDLVDRGPDSGGVIDFMIHNRVSGIMGNHEESILNHWKRHTADGFVPRNTDKVRTLSQLNKERVEYLSNLPTLHVWDDLGVVAIHGGLWPGRPLYAQPKNVVRAQMIHPSLENFGRSRWWGPDATKNGKSEATSYLEGWRRWYEIYDHCWTAVFGHSVFKNPFVYENAAGGKCIGIDQGGCFGGYLTAVILPTVEFVQVKAKKAYVGRVFE